MKDEEDLEGDDEFSVEEPDYDAMLQRVSSAKSDVRDAEMSIADAIASSTSKRSPPNISHLYDAIGRLEDGTPFLIPDRGEKIIIERWVSEPHFSKPLWLSTEQYTIHNIDEETGLLRLWCDELSHYSYANYKLDPQRGYVFKMPGRIGKRKRRRRDLGR